MHCNTHLIYSSFNIKIKCTWDQEKFEDTKRGNRKTQNRQIECQQQQKRQKDNNCNSSITNPTKTGGEHRCSGRVGRSCSTCDTRGVAPVINPVMNGKMTCIVIISIETY